MAAPSPLLTFYEGPQLPSTAPPVPVSMLLHMPSFPASFISLMCKVEITIQPSS